MKTPRILFVLPAVGASGGANSVVQEAMGLSRFGANVGIAVNDRNFTGFLSNYPDLGGQGVTAVPFSSPETLSKAMETFDVVVATVNNSVFDIVEASAILSKAGKAPQPRIAYYVQDYEPLFYPADSEPWRLAHRSYEAISNAVLFAKTKWLQDVVYANHGIRVAKVSPSIDHGIYYPDFKQIRPSMRIVSMLRPKTPRRAPHRTLRIMETLAQTIPGVSFVVFGSSPQELTESGIELSPKILNRGVLRRHDVPSLMRDTDLFLDLSDYQAFGRTGLESMACGAIPVVPILGGTAEYAEHGRNAYVVDTRSDDEIIGAVTHFVALSERARSGMRHAALETAADFSINKASLSLLKVFREMTDM